MYTSRVEGERMAPESRGSGCRTKYGSSANSRVTLIPESCAVPPRSEENPIASPRSEERRVGKEGRGRWAPRHQKKKRMRGTRAGAVCLLRVRDGDGVRRSLV